MLRRYLGSVGSVAVAMAMVFSLSSCSGMNSASSATSLFSQLGGMDTVTKLGSGLLSGVMKDPQLTSLLGQVNPAVAGPKINDQLCAALGGSCKAPFNDDQIAKAADKLTPDQKAAVSKNFSSTLSSLSSNPAVRDAVTKSLGPKLGGIVGSIL